MYREVSYHIDAKACHWSLVDYRSQFCRNELPQILSLLYSYTVKKAVLEWTMSCCFLCAKLN